jgi:hypothetical protein
MPFSLKGRGFEPPPNKILHFLLIFFLCLSRWAALSEQAAAAEGRRIRGGLGSEQAAASMGSEQAPTASGGMVGGVGKRVVPLVEANRVEAEAEVEESDGDAVEQTEERDGHPCVDGLRLEEAQPLRDVQGEQGHHEVPARQRRRCICPKRKTTQNFRNIHLLSKL